MAELYTLYLQVPQPDVLTCSRANGWFAYILLEKPNLQRYRWLSGHFWREQESLKEPKQGVR